MRISKLFHWLYALLMLLPFMFFVPSVFYYAFNDNATMQNVEVPKAETIAVDFNQKVTLSTSGAIENYTSISGGVLTFNLDFTNNTGGVVYPYLTEVFKPTLNHVYIVRDYSNCTETNDFRYSASGMFEWAYSIPPLNGSIRFVCLNDGNSYFSLRVPNNYVITEGSFFSCQVFDLTQMFGSGNEPSLDRFNELFPLSYYPYVDSQPMQITYETGETEQLVVNTDIINYAWESIWDLPLFNWCKVSFVTIPFTYITGLFGLAASNSINYVITYFVSISIIWLVFDVIMYVPLLVHRWLDKARLE